MDAVAVGTFPKDFKPLTIMLKSISLFVSGVVLFIATLFGSSDRPVNVRQEIPAQAQTGYGIQITFHIERNGHEGFAKLQQAIPKGYGAEAITTGSAQFIRTEEEVKFIWTQLPQDEQFDVSYRLVPKKGTDSYLKLEGIFSYVNDNNKTEKVWVNPAEFRVGQRMTTRIENNGPSIQRRLIAVRPEEGEYRIELNIQPGGLSQAARFVDRIPTGFTATAAEVNGAEFSQNGRNVNFDWTAFPQDEAFTIAYTIRSGGVTTTPYVEGVLLYGDELVIANERPDVEQLPSSSIASGPVASNSGSAIVSNPVNNDDSRTVAATVTTPNAAGQNTNFNVTAARTTKTTAPATAAKSASSYASPEGIDFKVQFLATRFSTSRSGNWLKSYYHISGNVEMYEQDGWKKYVTGNYANFKSASIASNTIREYAKGAFVVAYRNGERIPVSEAILWSRTGN
ncbi:MAG: hypothetical protein RL021_424 [Bacteroidota bacterium]|jgi:hypothetical protein